MVGKQSLHLRQDTGEPSLGLFCFVHAALNSDGGFLFLNGFN